MHASISPEQEYPSLLQVNTSIDFSAGFISFCRIINPIVPPISSECIYYRHSPHIFQQESLPIGKLSKLLRFTQLPQDPVKGGLPVLGFQQTAH
jgi:hypothetical protein